MRAQRWYSWGWGRCVGRWIFHTCQGVWLQVSWKLFSNSQGFVCLGFLQVGFCPRQSPAIEVLKGGRSLETNCTSGFQFQRTLSPASNRPCTQPCWVPFPHVGRRSTPYCPMTSSGEGTRRASPAARGCRVPVVGLGGPDHTIPSVGLGKVKSCLHGRIGVESGLCLRFLSQEVLEILNCGELVGLEVKARSFRNYNSEEARLCPVGGTCQVI